MHALPELALAARDAGHAPLAGRPISGRTIEEDLPQPRAVQPLADRFGRDLIGREQLHALEPGLRGGLEPVEERQVGEQEVQVRAELERHVRGSARSRRRAFR